MAENDIYDSKRRYERLVKNLDDLHKKQQSYKSRYYCKNPKNIEYFREMITYFEMKDLSYIRRCRIFQIMRLIVYVIEKDLKNCDRKDINKLVAFSHTTHKTISSKKTFVRDLKCVWKILFPEKDQKGRIDETLTPYPVRHLTRLIDKSKQKLRNDRFTLEEFHKILQFFDQDKCIQAYLTLAFESLGRPQEILYTKIRDYEFYDNYAKIFISSHGKEGTGFLQCIDSYPYVLEWFRRHPLKSSPEAFFFINQSNHGKYKQLKNININKRIRHACKALGIDKKITCYSLKRNGVTFRRKRGDTDLQIQRVARWTSTKQLQNYDMTNEEDALQVALKKKGLIDAVKIESSDVKSCSFCGCNNGFTAEFCGNCRRPLDREKVEQMHAEHERLVQNQMVQRLDKMEQLFQKVLTK